MKNNYKFKNDESPELEWEQLTFEGFENDE